MKRCRFGLISAFVCLLGAATGNCEDDSLIPKDWRVFTTSLRGFFADEAEAYLGRSGFVEVLPAQPVGYRTLDLRHWFETAAGLNFPKRAIVQYFERSQGFLCIAPKETADLVEVVVTPTICGGPTLVRLEATLVAFQASDVSRIRDLPFARVRSVAGKSWQELEFSAVTAVSGSKSVAKYCRGDDSRLVLANATGSEGRATLAAGEGGCVLACEPMVGPDGWTIDIEYSYVRRLGQGQNADAVQASSKIFLKDGMPMIAEVWPQAGVSSLSPRKNQRLLFTGLVLRAVLVNPNGTTVRKAFTDGCVEMRRRLAGEKNRPPESASETDREVKPEPPQIPGLEPIPGR